MSERLKEHAWNACKVQAFVGSNPTLPARSYKFRAFFIRFGLTKLNKTCLILKMLYARKIGLILKFYAWSGDPYEIRTRVTAVKGRCPNR